jgi:nitrite reductase/ring-hydroxylating ferredoxin subunit
MSSWHPVANVADVKPGDVIAVEIEGVKMVVGRDGDRYFALQRHCVHRGGDLSDGIVARGHVVCANHGWRFSTATGKHDSASDVCLVVYAVRVTGDQIEVDPVPRTLRGY